MKNEIILFENQNIKLEVNVKDETVWLNREQLSILFDRNIKLIGKHINNVLKEELDNGSLSLDDFRMKIMRSSGRENIIEGLKNSFETLMAILKLQ